MRPYKREEDGLAIAPVLTLTHPRNVVRGRNIGSNNWNGKTYLKTRNQSSSLARAQRSNASVIASRCAHADAV